MEMFATTEFVASLITVTLSEEKFVRKSSPWAGS